jgi:signal transduction histidine kinase
MMQGQKDLDTVSRLIMSELTPLVGAHRGAFFILDPEEPAPLLKLVATYAYTERKHASNRFRPGEGLVGQCALEKKTILLTQVPPDYVPIRSALGEAPPLNVVVLPVLFEGELKGVIELASFHEFSTNHRIFLDQLTQSIGAVLNMIGATTRTEKLLQQSQSLTRELRSQSRELTEQQEELKRSNTALEKQAIELEEKAKQLERQKDIEIKNREVEAARALLEEKAEQLQLISRYKSQFLANVSHELRTPLNSLLVLSQLLAENKDANLSEKQVEYARTIHSSGADLLALIDDILDLSRVEAGKMRVEPRDVPLAEVARFVERSFGAIAEQKGLQFAIELAPSVPTHIRTDQQRLEQVLKNLLANAFKFTDKGSVRLRIETVQDRARFGASLPRASGRVLAFAVTDTGIGIPEDKQAVIFEAFEQADGATSRHYGGTGLGLSISREIARLLGGEIHVESAHGAGSTFTMLLPERAPEPVGRGAERDGAAPPCDPGATSPASSPPHADGPRPAPAPHEAVPGGKVLLVDDDVRNVFALTSMLESYGIEVVHAENGRNGIAALERHPDVDLVLMDVMMPEMDGYETMRAIRRHPAHAALPIIAVTAKALPQDRDECLAAGASDYLSKPVHADRLVELISAWTR